MNTKLYVSIHYWKSKLSLLTHKIIIKVILICLLISIIPVGIFSYITYKSTLNIMIDEYINSNQKILIQGSKVIENHFQQLQDIATSPYKDIPFLLNLTDVERKFLKLSYNESFLKDMFFYSDDIESIYFYANRSGIMYYYSKRHSGNKFFRSAENEYWYLKATENEHGIYISPLHNLIDYVDMPSIQKKPIYSINQSIINVESKEVLGLITLNISNRTINNFSKNLRYENEGILILNSDGEIISSIGMSVELYNSILSNKQIVRNTDGYIEMDTGDHKYIVIYSHFFEEMLLAKVISYEQFEKEAVSSIEGILKSAVIIFLVILFFSVFIILRLNSILHMIEANMQRISKGDFDIQMSYSGNDELSGFINNFNKMAQKIDHLINSEYKSKIALKNAQILALQTQINPHFMYNSLQVVSTLALRDNSKEIYKMLNAISNLLKYSLGKENSMVSLETEIEHMQNYLYVQKVRFGAKLIVEYNLSDETSDVKVPRLILQPLVENSLTHGTSENRNVNTIKVETQKENGYCIIVIQDNGCGIEPETLKKISSFIYRKDYLLDDEDHIGLHNVISRLRLIYNDLAQIQVSSQTGNGTKISIKIPMTEG